MNRKPYDILWPVVPKTIEDINTNFDALWNAVSAVRAVIGSSNVLPVPNGGTGQSAFGRGDILVADGPDSIFGLTAVAVGYALISQGAGIEPAYGKIALSGAVTHITGILPVASGGTGLASYAVGNLILATAPTTLAALAAGTVGQVLTMGASLPAWASPAHAILSAIHSDSTAAAVVRGDLVVGIGATPKWERLAAGAVGHILTMGATEPGWAAAVGGAHDVLSVTHGDTTPAAVIRGDLIIGHGAVPKWERLAKGVLSHVLTMDADEPVWAAPTVPAGPSGPFTIPTAMYATGADVWFDGAVVGPVAGIPETEGGVYWFDGALVLPATDASLIWGPSGAPSVVGQVWRYDGVTIGWSHVRADEIFDGILADSRLSTNIPRLDAVAAWTGYGIHTWWAGGPGGQRLSVRNLTAGAAAYTQILLGNDAAEAVGVLSALSTIWTPSGINLPDGFCFECTRAGGLSLAATEAAGVIRFYTGGTSERARFDIAGNFGIGTPDPDDKVDITVAGGGQILFGNMSYTTWAGISFNGSVAAGNYNLLSRSGQPLLINRPSGQAIAFRENNVTQLVLLAGGLGAFAAGDKYLIVDASGNLHVSTLGPLA